MLIIFYSKEHISITSNTFSWINRKNFTLLPTFLPSHSQLRCFHPLWGWTPFENPVLLNQVAWVNLMEKRSWSEILVPQLCWSLVPTVLQFLLMHLEPIQSCIFSWFLLTSSSKWQFQYIQCVVESSNTIISNGTYMFSPYFLPLCLQKPCLSYPWEIILLNPVEDH